MTSLFLHGGVHAPLFTLLPIPLISFRLWHEEECVGISAPVSCYLQLHIGRASVGMGMDAMNGGKLHVVVVFRSLVSFSWHT